MMTQKEIKAIKVLHDADFSVDDIAELLNMRKIDVAVMVRSQDKLKTIS